MIVRFGLDALPAVLGEAGISRPFVIASDRWRALDVPHEDWWSEVPSHRVAVSPTADGILGIGGGSAIDTAKAASSATGLPLVSVPTTYSGAEWTTSFGVRSPDRRMQGGGAGARPVGIVYDVDLTLELPANVTAGTAMNALAHTAEALYVQGRTDEGDAQALAGAPLIADALPRVLADLSDRDARTQLVDRGDARRACARDRRARARPRDGAGRRGAVRPPARSDERHLPAHGARVQPERRSHRDRSLRGCNRR